MIFWVSLLMPVRHRYYHYFSSLDYYFCIYLEQEKQFSHPRCHQFGMIVMMENGGE